MTLFQQIVLAAQADELEKIAATRQVKIMRKLYQAGKQAKAERLAAKLKEKGVLKITGPGTFMGRLGSGAEGVADDVIGATGARGKVKVRKAYDTGSATYSKLGLSEKMNVARKTKDEPRVAKMVSKKLGKGKSGGRYMIYDQAATPQGPALKGKAGFLANVRGALTGSPPRRGKLKGKSIEELVRSGVRGRRLGDVKNNPGNVVKGQIIDALPIGHPATTTNVERNLIRGRKAKIGDRASAVMRPNRAKPWGARQQEAAAWRSIYPGMNTTATDFSDGSLRRANVKRALQGLGPGSRQKKKVRGLKPAPTAPPIFKGKTVTPSMG